MQNKRNLVKLVIFVICLVAAPPLYMAGKYFYYVSQLTESIERNEVIPAREHLQEVQYYYNWSKRIPFGEYLADKFLFNEAWYFENAYNYVHGDCESVVNQLDGRQDYRAQHLVANCLFQIARKEYQSTDDEARKQEILDRVLDEISPYYERSLRMMPESTSEFNVFKDKWNYDLISNPKSAAGALGNKDKKPVYILGVPGVGDDGPGLEGKGEDGEEGLFDTAEPDEGDPPRKKRG